MPFPLSLSTLNSGIKPPPPQKDFPLFLATPPLKLANKFPLGYIPNFFQDHLRAVYLGLISSSTELAQCFQHTKHRT
jgi:hypothetical protein